MVFELAECEEKLGYEFKDKTLLRKCFTHSSYANEHGAEDNERLEFFGDAVLEMIVTEYLFSRGNDSEKVMTEKRASLVSKEPLLKTATEMGLNEYILLGKGQQTSKTMTEKLFSSLYEAIVCGIYLDGGMKEAKKFVMRTLIKPFEKRGEIKTRDKIKEEKTASTSYKNKFQEYVQKYKLGSIGYDVSRVGSDNRPTFTATATLNGSPIASGKGGTKKSAEAESAKIALEILKKTKRESNKH